MICNNRSLQAPIRNIHFCYPVMDVTKTVVPLITSAKIQGVVSNPIIGWPTFSATRPAIFPTFSDIVLFLHALLRNAVSELVGFCLTPRRPNVYLRTDFWIHKGRCFIPDEKNHNDDEQNYACPKKNSKLLCFKKASLLFKIIITHAAISVCTKRNARSIPGTQYLMPS